MYYPTYHQTNFFKNPLEIVEWSKSLDFKKPEDGSYPGTRTKPLHEISNDFYRKTNLQVLRLIYGNEVLSEKLYFESTSYFQKIKYEDTSYSKEGWIHTDADNILTCIIYLSQNQSNSGTSLFETLSPDILLTECAEEKFKYYKGKELQKKDYLKALSENNKKFRKIVEFKSDFNTMIAFDASHHHGATYDLKPNEERLTLITFFKKIVASHYPAANYDRNL